MSPSAVGHDPRRSRGQAHQNKYAFKHNKNSKKTQKIEETVNVGGLCERCAEKIEWRKKYRKYKPLTQPRKCNACGERKVKAAYRTLCNDCAKARRACPQCAEVKPLYPKIQSRAEEARENEFLEVFVDSMRERDRRTVLRKVSRGEDVLAPLIGGSDDEEDEDNDDIYSDSEDGDEDGDDDDDEGESESKEDEGKSEGEEDEDDDEPEDGSGGVSEEKDKDKDKDDDVDDDDDSHNDDDDNSNNIIGVGAEEAQDDANSVENNNDRSTDSGESTTRNGHADAHTNNEAIDENADSQGDGRGIAAIADIHIGPAPK